MLAELIRTTLSRRHFSFLFVWFKKSVSLFWKVSLVLCLFEFHRHAGSYVRNYFLLLIYSFYVCSNLEPNKYKDCKSGFNLHLN